MSKENVSYFMALCPGAVVYALPEGYVETSATFGIGLVFFGTLIVVARLLWWAANVKIMSRCNDGQSTHVSRTAANISRYGFPCAYSQAFFLLKHTQIRSRLVHHL
ncbi:hypothetical protein CIP107577_00207 [Corynebacterium diphtheriae]|nr:hypothetical protein B11Q_00218 [Corynebacterium diphtheriae]CAB0582114.1 hypothetical protein CIP107559_00308 [Corynebacterium diphtheriae]CAB0585342.1 hypothetical protein CIP107544_00318 [Corynebacterium diphtheriae]CAB0628666.1 hypothetical protein CIP107577_00207 [Corynebacterium diphtheriae]CAB0786892.1 hypothetical protein FRC0209_00296 [Corynebacterium diphtheriae]